MASAKTVLLANLKAANVTPKTLSDWLGLSDAATSMMLSGRRGIPLKHLDKIAANLEVTVPQLFTDRDLIGHQGDQRSDLSKKERTDAKAARPIASRVQHEYDTLLAASIDVAYQLATILVERGVDVAAVAHDAQTGARKPKLRKRPRKAG